MVSLWASTAFLHHYPPFFILHCSPPPPPPHFLLPLLSLQMIWNENMAICTDLPDCKNKATFKTIKAILDSTSPFIFYMCIFLPLFGKKTHLFPEMLFLVIVTVMLFKVYWAGKTHSYLFNLSNLYWILSSHILALGHFP